jgi:pyruvate formate lyase activating enzyme
LPLRIDWSTCQTCQTMDCTKACLVEAFTPCGREITVGELMEILARDRHFWAGKGGVTFSGGEPFAQKEFLLAALKACKSVYIHTAIETSGYTTTENYLGVMKYVDFAFNDIKHIDSRLHQEKTGLPNELILKNISALANSNWKGRLVLRSPIIENFNDTIENMKGIAAFMHSNGLQEFNLLPFHPLGDSKWTQCGMEYPYKSYGTTPTVIMNKLAKVLREAGITTYIGGNTPF